MQVQSRFQLLRQEETWAGWSERLPSGGGCEGFQNGYLPSEEKVGRGSFSGDIDIRDISQRISCRKILTAISERSQISVKRLRGSERNTHIVVWRQLVHYLCRELTSLSFPVIAKAVNRDHTTLLNSIRRIEERMNKDPALRNYINRVRDELKAEFFNG